MKIIIKSSFLLGLIFVVFFANGFAQQWSDAQKEVWSGVEKYWDISAKGDARGFMSYFDDSYMGWNNQSRVPQSKVNTSKWVEDDIKSNSTILYTITPLTIWVKGDFAYVHYTYSQLLKNNETGKKISSSGIWTDILMKKDGKWMLIGDHGGRISADKKGITE